MIHSQQTITWDEVVIATRQVSKKLLQFARHAGASLAGWLSPHILHVNSRYAFPAKLLCRNNVRTTYPLSRMLSIE
jgi:hypothetical protein